MEDIQVLIRAQQILEANCKEEDDHLLLEWVDNKIKRFIDKEIHAADKKRIKDYESNEARVRKD